jgi:hypothetical protein
MRMKPSHCDPRLGADFKGIERFYPFGIVEDAVKADEFMAAIKVDKPVSISATQLAKAKVPLLNRLLKISDKQALDTLMRVWTDIKAAI